MAAWIAGWLLVARRRAAPAISAAGPAADAIGRVISSLKAFSAYQGPLRPHFAYGDLSKEEYTDAHLLHIQNHMQEISA